MARSTLPDKAGATLADSIIRIYDAGGVVLALIFVGTLLLLGAVAKGRDPTSYVAAGAGAIVILATLARVYLVEFNKMRRVRKSILENQALLDSVQEAAIQLTDICAALQALAFKHANTIRPLLGDVQRAVRRIKDVPVLGKTPAAMQIAAFADHDKFREVDDMYGTIVDATEGAKKVIQDLRSALVNLDAAPIIGYSKELLELKTKVLLFLKHEGA